MGSRICTMYTDVICLCDTAWAAEGRDGGVVDAVVYIWGSTSAQFPTCMQGPASSKQITCKLSVSCSENSVLPPVHRSPSDGRKGRSVSITVFCVPNLIGQRCLFIALLNRIIFLVISDQWFPHRQLVFLLKLLSQKSPERESRRFFSQCTGGYFDALLRWEEESSTRMTLRGGTVVCCQGSVFVFLIFNYFHKKVFVGF